VRLVDVQGPGAVENDPPGDAQPLGLALVEFSGVGTISEVKIEARRQGQDVGAALVMVGDDGDAWFGLISTEAVRLGQITVDEHQGLKTTPKNSIGERRSTREVRRVRLEHLHTEAAREVADLVGLREHYDVSWRARPNDAFGEISCQFGDIENASDSKSLFGNGEILHGDQNY